jgi:cobalt/nickel transport system permease protein
MHLEEFAEGTSFFHRLDPRVKIVTLLPYMILVAVSEGLHVPVTALLVSFVMVLFARLDFRMVMGRLVAVNIFVLMLWVFIPFSYPGTVLFSLGGLSISRQGILYVLTVSLKTNAIVIATIAVLGTSEVFALAHACVHLRVPDKLVYLFFFFYRYISVLHEQYVRLRKAMKIRCFSPGTDIHTYKSYAYLIGMLIVNSYERSQRIYDAMLCRGFTGSFPIINHFSIRKNDKIFIFLMTMVFIVLLYMKSEGG